MIEPRLASSVQVSAFVRLANLNGDSAMVLRKGDPTSGAILVIGLVRGMNPQLFERFPSLDSGLSWQRIDNQDIDNESKIVEIWQKRAARDPDLWVIELDVASQERLVGLLG